MYNPLRFQVLMSSKGVKDIPLFPEVAPKREHRKKRSSSSSQRRTIDCFSQPLSAGTSSDPVTPQPVPKSRRSSSASSSTQRRVCTQDVTPPQKRVTFSEPLEQPSITTSSSYCGFSLPFALSSGIPFGRSLDYHFPSVSDPAPLSLSSSFTG